MDIMRASHNVVIFLIFFFGNMLVSFISIVVKNLWSNFYFDRYLDACRVLEVLPNTSILSSLSKVSVHRF